MWFDVDGSLILAEFGSKKPIIPVRQVAVIRG